MSPWNTPVLVVKKKSRKWRWLYDLRKIHLVMEGMGICKLVCLPLQWYLLPGTSWLWTLRIVFSLFHCTQTTPQSLLLQCLPLITLHQWNIINGEFFPKAWETVLQSVNDALHKHSHQWEDSFQGYTVIITCVTFWLQPKQKKDSHRFSQTCCKC